MSQENIDYYWLPLKIILSCGEGCWKMILTGCWVHQVSRCQAERKSQSDFPSSSLLKLPVIPRDAYRCRLLRTPPVVFSTSFHTPCWDKCFCLFFTYLKVLPSLLLKFCRPFKRKNSEGETPRRTKNIWIYNTWTYFLVVWHCVKWSP